jgi:hypothetical protein
MTKLNQTAANDNIGTAIGNAIATVMGLTDTEETPASTITPGRAGTGKELGDNDNAGKISEDLAKVKQEE